MSRNLIRRLGARRTRGHLARIARTRLPAVVARARIRQTKPSRGQVSCRCRRCSLARPGACQQQIGTHCLATNKMCAPPLVSGNSLRPPPPLDFRFVISRTARLCSPAPGGRSTATSRTRAHGSTSKQQIDRPRTTAQVVIFAPAAHWRRQLARFAPLLPQCAPMGGVIMKSSPNNQASARSNSMSRQLFCVSCFSSLPTAYAK